MTASRPPRPHAGQLLVAGPTLGDPPFRRSVVLMLAVTAEGALGLVLNRPLAAGVEEILPAWSPLAAPPARVFGGGPVGLDSAIGLAVPTEPAPLAAASDLADDDRGRIALLHGQLLAVDLGAGPQGQPVPVQAVRIFLGSAGWGPGQLDDELATGSWYVVDALPDDVVTSEPGQLWRSVLRRQPGELALLASFPDDPTLN